MRDVKQVTCKTTYRKLSGFFGIILCSLSLMAVSIGLFSSLRPLNSALGKTNEIQNRDYSDEVEVDGSKLKINASSSTSSLHANTFNIVFSTGAKVLIDTEMSYTVNSDSSDLMALNDQIQSMDLDERKAMQKQIAEGSLETSYFDGFIYSIEDTKSDVILPETLSRGTYKKDAFYTVNVNEIKDYAVSENAVLTTISIPKTITKIAATSFINAKNLTKIKCQCSEAEKPDDWAEGWNAGVPVEWGVNIYEGTTTRKNANTVSTKLVGDDDNNFIIGYVPNDSSKTAYPLVFEYCFQGESEKHYYDSPKMNVFEDYDYVGKGIGGESGLQTEVTVNIETPVDKTVDFSSIKVHNIFKAVKEGEVWVPDTTQGYFGIPTKGFKKNFDLSEFLTFSYKNTTVFCGYTGVNVDATIVNNGEIYSLLKPSIYKTYESKLKSGEDYVRFRFTSLKGSYYYVTFGDKEAARKVDTPISQFVLKRATTSSLSFVFKDSYIDPSFTPDQLKDFAMYDVVISLDIIENGISVLRSKASVSFGSIYFKTSSNANTILNLNNVVIITACSFSALAIIIIVVLFFVFKKVYKNDEFKRLKPKQFIKKGVIYWLCSLAVALEILFIIIRCVFFNNAIVVYNPVDIFVIFFGIASVIIIGYFIKNLVVYIQTTNKNKKKRKLGIGNDVVQDGTK